MNPIAAIKARRKALDAYNRAAASARPGEVWTITYDGWHPWDDTSFATQTIGPAVIHAGALGLGEYDLGQPYEPLGWWEGIWPSQGVHTLERGDAYGDHPLPEQADAADVFRALPDGVPCLVEWRMDHPAYEGARFLADGILSPVRTVYGATGRHVGAAFVDFADRITYVSAITADKAVTR
jgi:hypothetical protein